MHIFQSVFDTGPVDIIAVEDDGRIGHANERLQKLLGVCKPTITSRSFDEPDWEQVDKDGASISIEDLSHVRVLSTGKLVFGSEYEVRLLDWSDR